MDSIDSKWCVHRINNNSAYTAIYLRMNYCIKYTSGSTLKVISKLLLIAVYIAFNRKQNKTSSPL